MTHRKALAGAAALALAAAGTGTAVASQQAAPKNVTVKGVGNGSYKINRAAIDGTRFDRDTYTVRSGGTLTLINTQAQEGPHTLTVLKRSQLPRTTRAINRCGDLGAKTICSEIAAKHEPNEQDGTVGKLVVNAGKAGLNQAGDSVFVGPKGSPISKIKIKVTAKKGSTLHFICLIHPWMQAKLLVK